MILGISGAVTACAHTNEADIDWESLHVYGDENIPNSVIEEQIIDDKNTFILPSTISPTAVSLHYDIPDITSLYVEGTSGSTEIASGDYLDLTALCTDDDYRVVIRTNNNSTDSHEVTFLFSENIDAMYLISSDPANEGRTWVESSENKSNKATGNMVLQNPDGSIIYDGELTQIKGRGNTTWGYEKKPYQIKLEEKTDLLATDHADNASKTWVLLANYLDPTLMRNTLALNLGHALGMNTGIEGSYIDLYYDGEYRGCYLLTEKVEVGGGRVDIEDMEEMNEEANEDIDIEDLPIATAETANGATYTYCEGMKSPDNISGGYLLEMDFGVRAVEEVSYFYTKRNKYVVVKSPEFASKEEMDYIATLYQDWEDAIYNNGINPNTGKDYTDYVDLDSMVQCYLINEFTKNRDGFLSSAYLYKSADEDIMYMGPLWDYDLSLGKGGGSLNEDVKSTGLYTARTGIGETLCSLGSFREAVKTTYNKDMYPLIESVILGDPNAISADSNLHSLAYYEDLIKSPVKCDQKLWRTDQDWSADVDYLQSFIKERAEYLKITFDSWSTDDSTFVLESDFTDVSTDDWFCNEAHAALAYGLMFGVGGDSFDPEGLSQRAHVAQTLHSMEKFPIVELESPFSDVYLYDWYSNAVIWASNNNFIFGYPDGTFKPTDYITREDLVTILYRYHGSSSVDTAILNGFSDAASVSDYAKKALAWAVNEKIIYGDDNQQLNPKSTASRAELAAILVRYYEKYKL